MSDAQSAKPYGNTRDHLRDELARVDLLLRRHLEAWWADPERGRSDTGGFFVSDAEVDNLLASVDDTRADGHERDAPTAVTQRRLATFTDAVRKRVARSVDAGVDLRIHTLAEAFELSTLECDALLLALAPDLDRKYEKVYGYLHDDVTSVRPTVGLVRRVLAGPDADRLALTELLDGRCPLVAEGLVEVTDGATLPANEIRVRKRIIEFILGGDAVASPIADAASVIDPRVTLAEVTVADDRVDELERLTADLADEPPRTVAFVGADERTATAAVEAVCNTSELLRVDADSLSPDRLDGELAAIRREMRLRGCPIHVSSIETLAADGRRSPDADAGDRNRDERDALERFVVALDSVSGHVFLTGDAPITAALQPRLDEHVLTRLDFHRPDYEQRRALWNDIEGLPEDVDSAALAGTFRFTSGQIADAVDTARSIAGGELTGDAIREGCRIHAQHDLDELAREVEPAYGWDDIVLPDDTLAHLHEVTAGIRHRGTVYDEWGFKRRFSLGNGINLLFTGPSGTGKTMAAEIIAGDVGLPMYKLDLSSVLSKYIGETEKNLGRVFDQAERGNAILFFDEADALFGERTEISDSRDRYANVEVDYLLQRMEEHDGCVIMATNLKENIDDAFRRRINATVEFPMPDEAARREIWESIFPDETPVRDVDVAFLAGFELAGGSIKNVALAAAFMAADEDEPVGMTHLVRALRREFQKTGKLYDSDSFGEYGDMIR